MKGLCPGISATYFVVLTGRGQEELPKVGNSGPTGFLLAADLAESVDLILGLLECRG